MSSWQYNDFLHGRIYIEVGMSSYGSLQTPKHIPSSSPALELPSTVNLEPVFLTTKGSCSEQCPTGSTAVLCLHTPTVSCPGKGLLFLGLPMLN